MKKKRNQQHFFFFFFMKYACPAGVGRNSNTELNAGIFYFFVFCPFHYYMKQQQYIVEQENTSRTERCNIRTIPLQEHII